MQAGEEELKKERERKRKKRKTLNRIQRRGDEKKNGDAEKWLRDLGSWRAVRT